MFQRYLKYKKKSIAYILFSFMLILASALLYHIPVITVIYPMLICLVAGILAVCYDYRSKREMMKRLDFVKEMTGDLLDELPEPESLNDEEYISIIEKLCGIRKEEMERAMAAEDDMTAYYTMWVHQIKTPIASMRLMLDAMDSDESRRLKLELARIEQYAEMVLAYIRLDSDDGDYVIREYELEPIVRNAVRKFAGEFIDRKVSLELEEIDYRVITDEKWLSFIIEQVLSNAIKYTRERGNIKIFMKEDGILAISDTGIGISPSDLPRVFDNGYTGLNGRYDKRASGIGLYLCRRAAIKLGHSIYLESEVGKGTICSIDIRRNAIGIE